MYNRGLQGWVKHLDFMILDFIIIELSFIGAFTIRHPGSYIYSVEEYRIGFFVLAFAVLLGSMMMRIHSDILKRGYMQELISVVKLSLFTAAVMLAYMFFVKTWVDFSRLVVFFFILLSTALLYGERLLWKNVLIRYRSNTPSHIRHMFLITTKEKASRVIEIIRHNSYGEIELVGMALADAPEAVGSSVDNVPVAAALEDVIDYIGKQWVDEMMIYLPADYETPQDILRECSLMGITSHVALRLGGSKYAVREVEEVAGIYSVTESLRIVDGYLMVAKRLIDIAGSAVGLIITLFLTIFVGPLIFIADPGPIFFSQERVGKNGRIFRMLKFRSMYRDAEKRKAELMKDNEMQGLMFKMEDDPRIIGSGSDGKKHGIGWFIRKTSIDEFPQFLNVFLGDMSLVGTRPPTVDEWEKYEMRHRARLAMKPGLTGLWQAYGRGEVKDFDKVVDMDMQYINTWTIAGDLKILFHTVGAVITGRGAK